MIEIFKLIAEKFHCSSLLSGKCEVWTLHLFENSGFVRLASAK